MPVVYAVVFDSNIVKFGRSDDVLRRVKEHKISGRQHGSSIVKVFVSTVANAKRQESLLLDSAFDMLEQVSDESYMFDDNDDVGRCFDASSLSYITFSVRHSPFELVLDRMKLDVSENGFVSVPVAAGKRAGAKIEKICEELSEVMSGGVVYSYKELRASLINRYPRDISSALCHMIKCGDVVQIKYKHPFYGIEYDDLKRSKFKLT